MFLIILGIWLFCGLIAAVCYLRLCLKIDGKILAKDVYMALWMMILGVITFLLFTLDFAKDNADKVLYERKVPLPEKSSCELPEKMPDPVKIVHEPERWKIEEK